MKGKMVLAVLAVAAFAASVVAQPPVVAGSWVDQKKAAPDQGKRHPWMAVYDRVTAGETVWVSVGEDYPDAVRIDNPPEGVSPGVYKCFRQNGENVFGKLFRPAAVASYPIPGGGGFPLVQSGCAGGRCPTVIR